MESKSKNQKNKKVQQNVKTEEINHVHEFGNTIELESRHARARVFVRWLAKKFLTINNHDNFSSKTITIYDVAGGKGEIAFELCIKQKQLLTQHIKYIIIDPRKPNKYETATVPKWQRKIIKVHNLLISLNIMMDTFLGRLFIE